MFETLISQYLNKLIESQIGHRTSPEAFHAIKVQGFNDDGIKPLAKIGGKFPMPIAPLICNVSIEPRKLTDSTPPVARSFHFTRKCFVEMLELSQGVFQGLGVVNLFACVQGQVGIHTEVYPDTLTCRKIGFGCGIVGNDIEPIRANRIAKDLNIAKVSEQSQIYLRLRSFPRGRIFLPHLKTWVSNP